MEMSQRKTRHGRQARETMLRITGRQGDMGQKHHEIPPDTPATAVNVNKIGNSEGRRGCGEKGTLLHCWWECDLMQPRLENRVQVPQRGNNGSALRSSMGVHWWRCTPKIQMRGNTGTRAP